MHLLAAVTVLLATTASAKECKPKRAQGGDKPIGPIGQLSSWSSPFASPAKYTTWSSEKSSTWSSSKAPSASPAKSSSPSLYSLKSGSHPTGPSNCYTYMHSTSVANVVTSTSIVTTTLTSTITTTPTVTATSPTSTSISSSTTTVTVTTTGTQATDTTTTTTTTTSVTTSSAPDVTNTSTSTTTTVTTVDTVTTVPTPDGFIPAGGSLPGVIVSDKKKRQAQDLKEAKRQARRDSLSVNVDGGDIVDGGSTGHGAPVANGPFSVNRAHGMQGTAYPSSVLCKSTVTVTNTLSATVTATGSTVTTTVAAPTVTSTTVVTSTSTSVQPVGDATTTVTVTATSVTTTVTTSTTATSTTVTNTQTSFSYTSTAYDACQTSSSDNLVYSVNTNGIGYFLVSSGQGVTYPFNQGISSPYDCCVSCIVNSDCAGAAYLPGEGCYNIIPNDPTVCTSQSAISSYVLLDGAGTDVDDLYVVSNGFCGEFNSEQS